MKTKLACIVLAMAAAAPAWAGTDPLEVLAQESGLSERKVQMILGVRTSFAEYPYTYQRSLEKFVAAIGKDNYQRLMDGQPVALRADEQGRTAVIQLDEHGKLTAL